MKLLTQLTKIFTYCFAAALMLAYLAPYVSAKSFWPIMFFGIAYPWLVLVNFFILLGGILFKKRRFVILPFLAIFLGINYLSSFFGFNFSKKDNSDNLKLVSYNINSFYGVDAKKNYRLQTSNPVLETVKELQVDFACFQELFLSAKLEEYMDNYNLFKYEKNPINFFYQGSNHEFLENGFIARDDLNGVSWFEIEKEQIRVRVYNIHLKSNQISLSADKFYIKEDFFTMKMPRLIKSVLIKLIKGSKIRVRQAEELAAHISECPYPVIVCGDLNEVPLSYPYRIISKGLKDAFHEKGRGFGFTYAGKIPGLRLDYVLVSPEIEIVDLRIGKDKLSDHYPLIAYLKIK